MSDINDPIPFINYGEQEAQIPNTNASTNLMGSQAGLVNQQARGAAIQNANNMLQLQALQIGLSRLYSMPGSGMMPSGQADASGSIPGVVPNVATGTAANAAALANTPVGGSAPPAPGAAAIPGVVGAGAVATPVSDQLTGESPLDDEIGVSLMHPQVLDSQLRDDFQVNPLGTPQEQQNILQMGMVSALTKNPAYVEQATRVRDMSVAQRRFQAQQVASNFYDTSAAVVNAADDGNAFQILQRVAPAAAKNIQAQNPDATPEELNELAADTAAHTAAHLHQWTGREVTFRSDGVPIDSQTSLPVAGIRGTNMTPEQYSDQIDKANTPVTIKNSDGSESSVPLWQYAKSQGAPVTSANDYVRYMATQQQAVAQHQQSVQDQITAAQTIQNARNRFVPQPGQPGAAPPNAAPAPPNPALAPVSVTAQRAGVTPLNAAAPGQPAAAPPNAPPPLSATLPGVNIDAIPKVQQAPVIAGRSQSTQAQAQVQADVANANKTMAASQAQAAQAARNSTAYAELQKTLANADPRSFGPSSSTYKAVQGLRTYLTGVAPGGLVDQATVDKYLSQLGVIGSKALLGSGQQLRQQEMLLLMARANPNIDQPMQVIKNLAAYGQANNEYDLQSANTTIAAVRRGADPYATPGAIESQSPRATYVQKRISQLTGTPSAPAANQAPDSGGFVPGKQYRDKNGNTATYVGNGAWQ